MAQPQKLVKFNQWYQGFRCGETAGFTPEEADRLCNVEKVAEPYELPKELTPKEKAAAEKAAREAEEKAAKEEADRLEAEKKKAAAGTSGSGASQ
jgi:hypothetical protein